MLDMLEINLCTLEFLCVKNRSRLFEAYASELLSQFKGKTTNIRYLCFLNFNSCFYLIHVIYISNRFLDNHFLSIDVAVVMTITRNTSNVSYLFDSNIIVTF